MSLHTSRRGFTLLEVLVVVLVLMVLLSVLIVAGISGPRSAGAQYGRVDDSARLREIHQAMVSWALNHDDRYPLPSALDLDDATVPEKGRAKDTTANVFSLMIWNGLITVSKTVSPGETNPNITRCAEYQYGDPVAAVDPENAVWDPAYRADFITGTAHNSYAHVKLDDARVFGEGASWGATYSDTQAVLSNRGPRVDSVGYNPDSTIRAIDFDETSRTRTLHGGSGSWAGFVAYNGGFVVLEKSFAPEAISYTLAGQSRPDVLFFDEPDDPAGLNACLGVFTRAGSAPEEYEAIWD